MEEQQEEGVTFEVEEPEVQKDGRQVTRRGVYLLPNLFTTAGLFAGFYAVIAAMNGQFEKAAIAITVAANLDVLDGAVARLTKTQSEFGAQYDSLHDLVSFGLAPAILIYAWALQGLSKLGWMVAFVYVACAALRLARFNSQNQNEDKKFFTGLGSPASALLITGFVWTCVEYQYLPEGYFVSILALLVCLWAGLLMVSNFKYSSPKRVDLQGRVPFVVILAPIFCLAIFFINPPVVMLIVASLYSLSGPVFTLISRN